MCSGLSSFFFFTGFGGVGSVLFAPGGVAVLVVALEAGGVSGLGVLALAVLLKTNILVFLFRYLSMTT